MTASIPLRRERRTDARDEARRTGKSFYECWKPLSGPAKDGTIATVLRLHRERRAAEKAAAEKAAKEKNLRQRSPMRHRIAVASLMSITGLMGMDFGRNR